MSALELIVAALAGGASAGLAGTTTSAINDTYASLKRQLAKKFTERPGALKVLVEGNSGDVDFWHKHLADDLTDSGAISDEQILGAASEVMALVEKAGNNVTVTNFVTNNSGAVGKFDGSVSIVSNANPPQVPAAD